MDNALSDFCEYIANRTELKGFERSLYLELGWVNDKGTPTAIGDAIYKTYGGKLGA